MDINKVTAVYFVGAGVLSYPPTRFPLARK